MQAKSSDHKRNRFHFRENARNRRRASVVWAGSCGQSRSIGVGAAGAYVLLRMRIAMTGRRVC